MTQEVKPVQVTRRSMWGSHLIAVKHALCSDGKRRYARVTGEADTYWTCPAQVQVRGKTVTGFLVFETVTEGGDIIFHAYQNKKNGHMLP